MYYSNYGSTDLVLTILILVAFVFSFWAQAKVKGTYEKYSKNRTHRGLTGAEAARVILDKNDLRDVPVIQVEGTLTDYYDPTKRLVALGEHEHDSTSPVAIGVAAHECGHAIQYKNNYLPAKVRLAIIPACSIGSKLSIPMIIVGILLSGLIPIAYYLVYIGIILFGLVVLVELITLPTEFDASNRALKAIDACGILTEEERAQAKEVLIAAALTYVAALAVSLLQLLRLILRSRKD